MFRKLLFASSVFFLALPYQGKTQCVSIACPGNVTAAADSGMCSAVVSFSAPVGTNSCTTPATMTFNYTGTIETFTVPAGVTSITVEAYGAQGGGGSNNGGRGAYIKGDIAVTPGQQLQILVGQQGQANYGYGGGGGSFVASGTIPLIVAGGGGGAEHNNNFPGFDAVTTNDGMTVLNGVGGTNGNGGQLGNPNTSGCGWPGSGGGGFVGDGDVSGDGGGSAFLNGGYGGIDPSGNCVVGGLGGFGGGGAGGNAGGGGGGYSGGAGGANVGLTSDRGGGGGGSFNSGTNQVNTAGVQTGNGLVVFTYNAAGPAYISQLQGLPSGSAFPGGVTTNVFLVTDSLGSTDTCSFTVTVNDMEAPVISCPSDMNVNTDAGMCSAIVTFTAPAAIDNCSSVSMMQTAGPASGSAFPVGSTAITYTATDTAGNSSSCSFNIIVADAEAPSITCPATITVNADSGMCSAVVYYTAPSATDNCNVASVTLSTGPASGSVFPVGTTTITYIATDSSGNMSNCSFDIVVNDIEAPVFAGLSNVTMNADSGMCSATVIFADPTAMDNCSAATVAQTGGPASGSSFPAGTTTITYTATDSAGNVATGTFDVIVLDTEGPVIYCPAAITVCDTIVTGINLTAQDLCSGVASYSYTLSGATTGSGNGDASGTDFNSGVTTVTYTATDSSGNTSSCSFMVTVTMPVLDLSASATTVCVDDGSVALTGLPAGGTWSGPGVTGNSFSPATAGNGAQTLTYTYTDGSGCTNAASLLITVNPCTGITEQAGFDGLQVFPNPTQGAVNIVFGNEFSQVDLSLTQINGQLVREEEFRKVSAVNLSVEDLPAGIYFLTIKADGHITTIKLVRN